MRIACAGSSGTGKTTIAKWVQEEFKLEFNPVGSRSVSKAMGFDNPYDVDKAGKRAEFQTKLLDDKVAWEEEHDSFITDRTTFDNLLYTALHDVHSIPEEQINKAALALERYDLIIFFPVNVFCNIAGDPHRVVDMAYHRIYDASLRGFFSTLASEAVSVFYLEEADLAFRKRVISGCLSFLQA